MLTEKRAAYNKAYYQRNREKVLADSKEYYQRTGGMAVPRRQYKHRKHIHLKHLHGITPEQHTAMLEAQEGLCAICREAPATNIDHDHRTGKVRGLLCWKHNIGLGHFGDSPELLARARTYLEESNAGS